VAVARAGENFELMRFVPHAMGRVAGHNVACDPVGEKMIPIAIGYHTTILDLGA
jgi:hypothetical protein